MFQLLSSEHSLSQIKTLCLLKWAKMVVLHREGAFFIVKCQRKRYPITALQVNEACSHLDYLGSVPGYPVRLARIGFHRPVRADFQDVSFGDFLALDNFYQGYLQTHRGDLLVEMAKIMYQSKRIRLDATEEKCIFYWYTSVKQMFANMIRALTGGDVTKEREVLQMDCWRALTELDAKVKDYADMKKSVKQ